MRAKSRCIAVCFIVTLVGISSNSFAQHSYKNNQLVQYGKTLDVRELDPSLSSGQLDKWLRHGPVHSETVTWHASPTCELKAPVENDYPICVTFGVRRGQIEVWGIIRIGTRLKGVNGPPHLEHLEVMRGLQQLRDW